MIIKLHLINEAGLHFEGDEPASVLDINEPLFQFIQPIHYVLDAQWVGEGNLLVTGRLSTVVRAKCVRTLEWFDLPLAVESFTSHHTDLKGDEVDLTEEIREDILILLPANPVSPDAKPLGAESPPPKLKDGGAWDELDKLKFRK